jgi:hypothetical protein
MAARWKQVSHLRHRLSGQEAQRKVAACLSVRKRQMCTHRLMIMAEEVLPMPGGPLSRTAFLDMSLLRPLDLASCGASPRICTLSL